MQMKWAYLAFHPLQVAAVAGSAAALALGHTFLGREGGNPSAQGRAAGNPWACTLAVARQRNLAAAWRLAASGLRPPLSPASAWEPAGQEQEPCMQELLASAPPRCQQLCCPHTG